MYWPRTTCCIDVGRRSCGRRQCSTPTLASRTTSGASDQGGSIATTHSTWSMWFCTMSRRAPTPFVVAGAGAESISPGRRVVLGQALLLGHGDLHVVDVLRVPQRLEDAVGEAQHQQVLHRLLAEVVVDAVGLALGERRRRPVRITSRALSRSRPIGFSTMTRRERRAARRRRGPCRRACRCSTHGADQAAAARPGSRRGCRGCRTADRGLPAWP